MTWLFQPQFLRAAFALSPDFERHQAAPSGHCLSASMQRGYIAMSGQIVDASLIAAPRQRNTEGEKKAIKDGAHPQRLER